MNEGLNFIFESFFDSFYNSELIIFELCNPKEKFWTKESKSKETSKATIWSCISDGERFQNLYFLFLWPSVSKGLKFLEVTGKYRSGGDRVFLSSANSKNLCSWNSYLGLMPKRILTIKFQLWLIWNPFQYRASLEFFVFLFTASAPLNYFSTKYFWFLLWVNIIWKSY